MRPDELLKVKRQDILALAKKHGIMTLCVFGSAARRDSYAVNDIDFLVKMEPGRSLLDLIAFAQDAEDLLQCQVDVVAEGGLSPYLKDKIYSEAVPL
jgi:predicted nucleotidyltransferase